MTKSVKGEKVILVLSKREHVALQFLVIEALDALKEDPDWAGDDLTLYEKINKQL